MNEEQKRELIDATVERIVATKADGEPFDTKDKFWASGFHQKAFEYLDVIISTVFLDSFDRIWVGDRTENSKKYPEPLAEELNRIPERVIYRPTPENATRLFILPIRWVDYPSLRKEVLRRLHRASSPFLGPERHDWDTVCEQYVTPAWARWNTQEEQAVS